MITYEKILDAKAWHTPSLWNRLRFYFNPECELQYWVDYITDCEAKFNERFGPLLEQVEKATDELIQNLSRRIEQVDRRIIDSRT